LRKSRFFKHLDNLMTQKIESILVNN